MSPVTRGFFGRRRIPPELADRVPPGQYVETGFPVLTAGPTPRVAEGEYALTIEGLVGSARTWTLPELRALPPSTFAGDIHCVTTWSKLGTSFGGVSVDTLLEAVAPRPEATHVVVSSYGGYTTNLPLEDVTGGKAWVVWDWEGQPLPREHGGPVRFLVPRALLLEVGEVGHRPAAARPRRAGLLGAQRLPQPRRPLEGGAVLGGLTGFTASRGDAPHDERRSRTRLWRRPARWPPPRAPRVRLAAAGPGPVDAAPPRPALRRPADRAGRLHRAALLLGRLRARGHRRDRAHRRPPARRRGVALPLRRGRRRRRARGPRADRRLVHLARRVAGAPRRRGLGRRAARRHAAPPPQGRPRGGDGPRGLVPLARRRPAPRRASATRPSSPTRASSPTAGWAPAGA